jgi:DNA-binding response OmpR family regulator
MYKILIVEDELIAAEYLKKILEKRGWEVVDIVDNGLEAIRSVKKYNPNLILMDIMINGAKSGCEVAMDIRKINNCFIVFLTAYADEEMINYAMEVEANGYIIKPYNEKEIIATISLLSIKQNCNTKQYKISKIYGGFCFNHDTNLLYQNEDIVKLGPRALKLVQILCQNRENIVSYEELYNNIWNDEINLKKLQMVVFRIREICKINFIENINGVGYQIKVDHSFTTI